jgi:RNA polymerase sigma factor (sigma-70 family)
MIAGVFGGLPRDGGGPLTARSAGLVPRPRAAERAGVAGVAATAFTARSRADLVRFAAARLGRTRLAGQDAEDLVQDVLVRLLVRGGSRPVADGAEVDHPEAYLRRAVANACVSHWRRHHRETPAEELPDRPLGDHSERCCTGIAVRRALAGLTERQREILIRGYFLDHADAEIAQALGISPVTVRTLRRRGLAHLRRLLATPIPGTADAGADGSGELARTGTG